uniref:Borealin C-terminal domain-containing protein n=2 Tax=Kalanchoe fedtschenkoi TaxID=63787 RepID=A0A7N0SVK9_KALFE
MANKRIKKDQATSVTDAEQEAPTAALSKDVEDQIAAIRAMRDLETNRLLTSLRLLRSYFTEEHLRTPVLEYFEQNLSNLVIVGNGKDDQLDVHWKTNQHLSLLHHMSAAYPDATETVKLNSMVSGQQLQFHQSAMDVPSGSYSQMIGFHDGLQTPATTGHRMSVGVTPKTLRLPKKGEMILSVRGSPLGVFQEKEDNMEAINETEEG